MKKLDIKDVPKDVLIYMIEKLGCKMLKGKLDGSESKEEIVAYLRRCNCPVLKKIFN
jgi:hypothetical protein